jgi:phage tail sheath gpL-like
MPVTTTTPASVLTPGSWIEFDTTTGSRGLVALPRRVALIGVRTTAVGTATNAVPYQIFTEAAADAYFGVGSELAIMCRAALKAARKAGTSPEIWAIAIAEASGVKGTRTFTTTGPATASGDVVFRIMGRTLRAPVINGDSANTVAASIKSTIDAMAATGDLQGVGSVATNVATFTLTNIGINGVDLFAEVVSVPAGVGVTAAVGVAGTGAAVTTPATDALVDKQYHVIAVANHTTVDITSLLTYTAARSAAGVKKWSFVVVPVTGTIATATTLATAANSEYFVIPCFEASPVMPGELAAMTAVMRLAQEDPSLTFSGTQMPPELYACPAASVFTPGAGGEVESALAGGVTPFSVTDAGLVYCVRLITSKTTVNSAPYVLMRDFGVPYTLTWLGVQADATVAIFMSDPKNKKMTLQVMKRLRSALLDMLRSAEALTYVQNVELHKAEIIVEAHPTVPTRLVYALPVSVVPGMEQAVGKLTLFLEAAIA